MIQKPWSVRRWGAGVRLAWRQALGRWRGRDLLRRGPGIEIEGGVRILGAGRIALGGHARLMREAMLWATDRGSIEVGERSYVGSHSWIVSNASIRIGKDVLIAPFCYVQDTDHGFADPNLPINRQASVSTAIVIDDDVWLGAHAVVTRGVHIGRGAVIGAGSVVTRDIPPWTVAVGAPARPVRRRAGEPPPESAATEPSTAARAASGLP